MVCPPLPRGDQMPTLEIPGRFSNAPEMAVLAALYIEAVMLFPHDDEKRELFVESALAHAFVQALKRGELGESRLLGDATVMRRAFELAPVYSEMRKAGLEPRLRTPKTETPHFIHGGLIAAYQLLVPLLTYRHGQPIGRVVTDSVLAKGLSHTAVGRLRGASLRNLEKIWQEYQSVAHLWTAFLLSEYCVPTSAHELVRFVSLAELIRRWAEQYRPRNSKNALLDRDVTWKAPAELRLPGPSLSLNGLEDS